MSDSEIWSFGDKKWCLTPLQKVSWLLWGSRDSFWMTPLYGVQDAFFWSLTPPKESYSLTWLPSGVSMTLFFGVWKLTGCQTPLKRNPVGVSWHHLMECDTLICSAATPQWYSSLVSDTFIRSATFLNDTRQGCHDTVYWSATLLYTESRLHVSELRYTALWSLVCNCDTLFRPQRWQWHQIMETKPMIAWLTKYIYHIHTQANTNKIN